MPKEDVSDRTSINVRKATRKDFQDWKESHELRNDDVTVQRLLKIAKEKDAKTS